MPLSVFFRGAPTIAAESPLLEWLPSLEATLESPLEASSLIRAPCSTQSPPTLRMPRLSGYCVMPNVRMCGCWDDGGGLVLLIFMG